MSTNKDRSFPEFITTDLKELYPCDGLGCKRMCAKTMTSSEWEEYVCHHTTDPEHADQDAMIALKVWKVLQDYNDQEELEEENECDESSTSCWGIKAMKVIREISDLLGISRGGSTQ